MIQFTPDHGEIERRVEALLFAASGPLSAAEIARRLPEGADVGRAISALRERYHGRGVELECVADRWQFRTAPDLSFLMIEEREEPRRLSRAVMRPLPPERSELERIRRDFTMGVARHLNHEDAHVYPQLLESEDAAIRAIACRLIAESGLLTAKFDDYCRRWSCAAICRTASATCARLPAWTSCLTKS